MFEIVEKHLPSVHCYADDTQVYVAFSPNQPGDDQAAFKAMSESIRDFPRKKLKRNQAILICKAGVHTCLVYLSDFFFKVP